MKTFIIDGSDFSDYDGFAMTLFSKLGGEARPYGLSWLDDILYGGVIGFEDGEEIAIVWKNNLKSKVDLNSDTSIPLSTQDRGNLYELILEIIQAHDNVHLYLDSESKDSEDGL